MPSDVTYSDIRADNERLMAVIASYWLGQGYEAPSFFPAFDGRYSNVPSFRSDMINGLPRKRK